MRSMRNLKRVTVLVVALVMLSVFCMPAGILPGFTPVANAATPEGNDDWLHVEGNQIVDMNGKPVWLTGTNWFGFNTGTDVFDGVWSCNMKAALKGMADRGINFLRIPVSTQILSEWKSGSPPMPGSLNDFVNPELKGLNSLEVFDVAVQTCKEVGMKIMIDVHSPASEAMGHIYPLWYDGTYTTETWISTLEWLAARYKNDDTILAFDIENEPHGKPADGDKRAKWDNSTDLNNWKHAAETCAKRVLAVNPNLLIMVEGIEVYPKEGYDYTAVDEWGQPSKYHFNWWGGNLRGVKDKPLDLGAHQDQLVYSPHDYGPMVWKQPWFYEGFNQETLYNDCWRDNWGFIYEEGISPLLIGEWGGFMDGGDNQKWMESLRDYIVENRIHHTFWCYNANSGDTGGLVTHDFMTWEEDKYALLKPALWQHNGKFVSLDHKVPLGSNGISCSEVNGSIPPPPSPSPSIRPTPTRTNPGITPTSTATPTPTIVPTPSNGGAKTFPYNATYKFGQSSFASNQSSTNQMVLAEWESWKAAHITSSGASGFRRVQRDASTDFDTVSEGIGYGMILAVYFDDQPLLNDLYKYAQKYFNGNGLMNWRIDANGTIQGSGAASDADEDIAIALVFADKKWGSNGTINYSQEAKTLINNIYNKMVEPGTFVLKPGDMWGGSSVTNPSYFAPAWYRIFADYTGNSNWIKVADKCYEIVNNVNKYNNNTGLVPDWCTSNGTAASGQGYDYYYDAIRYPLRTAIDYSWFGTSQAKANCDANAAFFKKIGPTNIKDRYTITGELVGQWHTATFVSCTAAGTMTGTDTAFGSSMLQETFKVKDQGDYTYFGNTLRIMSLLYLTGNLPNLYDYNPVVPTPTNPIQPTPTPTPTNPTYVVGDANGDGSFNSIDFAVVRMVLLGLKPQSEIDTQAADVDGSGQVNAIDFAYMRQRLLGMIDKFPVEG